MDTLKDYVEAMFHDFPKTEENLEVKANILASMEDKYEGLIAEGKSIQEATGIVITQFGDINELKEAYGVLASGTDIECLATERLNKYLSFWQKYAHGVALSAGMLIIAFLALILLQNVFGVLILTILVTLAVGILIFLHFRSKEYKDIEERGYGLHLKDQARIQNNYTRFRKKFYTGMIIGIVLCVLGFIPFLIPDDIFPATTEIMSNRRLEISDEGIIISRGDYQIDINDRGINIAPLNEMNANVVRKNSLKLIFSFSTIAVAVYLLITAVILKRMYATLLLATKV